MEEKVVIEIKPGTGGKEADLFAKELLRAYLKFAKKMNFKVEILNLEEDDLGGLKNAMIRIKGEKAFSKFQFESGVHRVQRIPLTEKSNRIHTSTVKVFVYKEIPTEKIKINPSELKIETMKATGAGGQYVNKRETAVRVIHLPTGISVKCQTERSLAQNKELALSLLISKLEKMKEREKIESLKEKMSKEIGTGERAEKIRTYNFPQDRITDHRISKSFRGLKKMMEGDLDQIILSLEKHFLHSPKP